MIVKPSYEIEAFDFTEKEQNICRNGGFELDELAGNTNVNPTDGDTSIFNPWIVERSGTTAPEITIREEAANVDTASAQACEIQITVAGSGTPVAGLYELVWNFTEYQGRKVSLRVRGHCSNADKMRAYIDDGVTKTYSSYHSGGGSYEDLDVEDFTVNAAATKLEFGFEIVADDTFTIYADNIMLVMGDTSMDYTPYNFIRTSNVAFEATLSTNQLNIADATFTKTEFDTMTYDLDGGFDTTNNRYVATYPGYYEFLGSVTWNTGTVLANTECRTCIYLNGSLYRSTIIANATATSYHTVPVNVQLHLDPADYVEVFVRQASGGAVPDIHSGSGTFFWGRMVRPD